MDGLGRREEGQPQQNRGPKQQLDGFLRADGHQEERLSQ